MILDRKVLSHPALIIGAILFLGVCWAIISSAGKGVALRPERLLQSQVALYRVSPRLNPFDPAAAPAEFRAPEQAAFRACAAADWREDHRIAAPKTVFYRCRSRGMAMLARIYYPEDFSDPQIAFAHCADATCPSEPAFPRLGLKKPQPKS